MELEALDQLIQDRSMTVTTQPPTDIRRRYESDGKRQIEKSRSKPMSIQVIFHSSLLLIQSIYFDIVASVTNLQIKFQLYFLASIVFNNDQ